MAKYYIDTCVWRDFYEERVGPNGRPLGEHAAKLMMKLIESQDEVIVSDLVITELKKAYKPGQINTIFEIFFRLGLLSRVSETQEDGSEALEISKERNLPPNDVLHAITARNNQAVLVSQDNHFARLADIVEVVKPEELL